MSRLRCPRCGEVAGVGILWGYPTPECVDNVEAGVWDVFLGGCVIPDPFVNVACRACGARWHDEGSLALDEDP